MIADTVAVGLSAVRVWVFQSYREIGLGIGGMADTRGCRRLS
jgi:hypothetical protein